MGTEQAKRQRGRQPQTAHNQTSGELVDAALSVAQTHGIAATTTRRIAAQAGLPLGTVHYWFANKDALIEAVITRLFDDVRHRLHENLRGASLAEDLHQGYAAVSNPDQLLVLFECILHEARTGGDSGIVDDLYTDYLATATAVTERWCADAQLNIPGGPAVLAQFIIALFDGLSLGRLASPQNTNDNAILTLVASLLDSASGRTGPTAD